MCCVSHAFAVCTRASEAPVLTPYSDMWIGSPQAQLAARVTP